MALIDPKATRRFEIPHEPGAWVELRPLTARLVADIQRDVASQGQQAILLEVVRRTLVAWSYDVPVTLENIDRLDFTTFRWIEAQLDASSGVLPEEERQSLVDASSPITDQEEARSLTSSGIS